MEEPILPPKPTPDQVHDEYYEHPDSLQMYREFMEEVRVVSSSLESPESVRMLVESFNEVIPIKLSELIPSIEACPKDIVVDEFGSMRGAVRAIDEYKAGLTKKSADDLTWHERVKYYAQTYKDVDRGREYSRVISGDTTFSVARSTHKDLDYLSLELATPTYTNVLKFAKVQEKWHLRIEVKDNETKETKVLDPQEFAEERFNITSSCIEQFIELTIPPTYDEEWIQIFNDLANTLGKPAPDSLTSLEPDEH